MSNRKPIPQKTKEQVLAEYDHKCAKCGEGRPQVHHIDENSGNNDNDNLIPLCPNCHLSDQHNPTKKIDLGKLSLFRRFKDPTILKPQFDPLYSRIKFLNSFNGRNQGVEIELAEILESAKDLIEFIEALEMGDFYSKKVAKLILHKKISVAEGLNTTKEIQNSKYQEQLFNSYDDTLKLIMELIRYQSWK